MRWSSSFLSSLVVHALVFGGLVSRSPQSFVPLERPRTEFVPLDLPPPPPPEVEEEVEPPEEPEPPPPELPPPPAKVPTPRDAPREPAPEPAVESEPQNPEADPSPDLEPNLGPNIGEVQLSNDGLAVGGGAKPGPTRPTTARAAPKPAPRLLPKDTSPPVVRVSDLSERPKPPTLDARLAKHYPSDLRRRGIEGEALVRLVLSESGRVIQLSPVSFSHEAFADACRKTLEGTEWSPPKDRNGKSVRTTLSYRCRFRVAL